MLSFFNLFNNLIIFLKLSTLIIFDAVIIKLKEFNISLCLSLFLLNLKNFANINVKRHYLLTKKLL